MLNRMCTRGLKAYPKNDKENEQAGRYPYYELHDTVNFTDFEIKRQPIFGGH